MQDAPPTADWPDRFVYVCSAGGAINVNIAPMVQAGANRIAGIVVAEGLSVPNRPNLIDLREATRPTQAILDFGRQVLRLPDESLKVYRGNGDLVGDWAGLIAQAQRLAEQLEATVLFNIAGGRKPMTVGGLVAALRGPDGSGVSFLTVGMNLFTLRLVRFSPDWQMTERPLPVSTHLDREAYLRMYGIEPYMQADSEALMQRLIDRTEVLDLIDDLVKKGRGFNVFAPLNRFFQSAKAVPFSRAVPAEGFSSDIRQLLGLLPEIRIDNGMLSTNSFEVIDFLTGDWLEVLCLRAVRKALVGTDVTVSGKFRFRRIGLQAEESEFDLLLYGRDKLAIAECKSITVIDTLRDGINRIDRYRHELSGRTGSAWLVAPLLEHKKLRDSGCLHQAKSQAVELLYGRDAIPRLVEKAIEAYRP